QPILSHDARRVMYITNPSKDRNELWVSDVDGRNKRKLAQSLSLSTGNWSPDDRYLAFMEEETGKPDKAYVIGADGSGLRTLTWTKGTLQNVIWGADQKSVYLDSFEKGAVHGTIWKESAEGSTPERLVEGCGFATDAAPAGQYLFTRIRVGENVGIYELSLADRKC